MLLGALGATDWLANTEDHFRCLGKWVHDPELGGIWVARTPMEAFGPILWVVPFCLMIVIVALLTIHLGWRKTIDADRHSGRVTTDWNACTPFQRILVANLVIVGLIVGLCVLCSNLARP